MNDESILTGTKKSLGLEESYTAFDPDIVMHINSVFSTLADLGLGPLEGYAIEDKETLWSDYLGTSPRLSVVKSYMYLRVRLLFDPPQVGFVLTAMKEQITEMEYRINLIREVRDHPNFELVGVDNPEADGGGA